MKPECKAIFKSCVSYHFINCKVYISVRSIASVEKRKQSYYKYIEQTGEQLTNCVEKLIQSKLYPVDWSCRMH